MTRRRGKGQTPLHQLLQVLLVPSPASAAIGRIWILHLGVGRMKRGPRPGEQQQLPRRHSQLSTCGVSFPGPMAFDLWNECLVLLCCPWSSPCEKPPQRVLWLQSQGSRQRREMRGCSWWNMGWRTTGVHCTRLGGQNRRGAFLAYGGFCDRSLDEREWSLRVGDCRATCSTPLHQLSRARSATSRKE